MVNEFIFRPLIPKSATSLTNKTGNWRSFKPILDGRKCTGCLLCWVLCPDASIVKRKTGKRYEVKINYDYCKGCGICSTECPVGAITMELEGQ